MRKSICGYFWLKLAFEENWKSNLFLIKAKDGTRKNRCADSKLNPIRFFNARQVFYDRIMFQELLKDTACQEKLARNTQLLWS